MTVFVLVALLLSGHAVKGDSPEADRTMRYTPDQGDFVIVNGNKRFNRALYGSHTGFRVEAGDLPEFGLYMPRLGGTLRLGIVRGERSKWLIDADRIEARYNNGSMRYAISDDLLGNGELKLKLLALAEGDGMILQMEATELPEETRLFWLFGGASDERFSREGDLGADPESVFYLKPENCRDNLIRPSDSDFFSVYYTSQNEFDLDPYYQPGPMEIANPDLLKMKCIYGVFPFNTPIKLTDAENQMNPLEVMEATPGNAPAISGWLSFGDHWTYYMALLNPRSCERPDYSDLPRLFDEAEKSRESLARQFRIRTPDEYINAAGNALAAAADGIYDGRSYMHGAIAWRMPLPGWRGAYAADWLGWPERAESHFRGYFKAQYTDAPDRPSEPDPETNLARQKEEAGTALFSDGYISRRPGQVNAPHHYDMNQVFIDQLLWHFRWTGDIDFIRESWPVLERHLAWEKRNFDANDDGLYDAYASIWASDALQYSGGGVTHSSAFNYRANRMTAELAPLVGKDAEPYRAEAEKIKKAVNENLWLKDEGWFAEYKDLLGLQRVHPSAAVWTMYHAIDEGLADPFQAWQCTEYIDQHIPHIPITGEGMPAGDYYTISTSSWMPYTWSINNVALAEVLHTALAYWQTGRSQEAFTLTKSSILDYMFMGSSPGNFGQLSFYDAFRGELYRDFADPVGVASRAFVEGLFGFKPNLLENEIQLRPGWPADWAFAEMEAPYLKVDFKKDGQRDLYRVENRFGRSLQLNLSLPCADRLIKAVRVNGSPTEYSYDEYAIGRPLAVVQTEPAERFDIVVEWSEILIEDSIQRLPADRQARFIHMQQDGAVWWQPVPQEAEPRTETPDKKLAYNPATCEVVPLDSLFNASVTNIFSAQYLSPRSPYPTLSLPIQGVGDWCSYSDQPEIDDRGIRRLAKEQGQLFSPQGIPFLTPAEGKNILFTSQWDVYPEKAEVPLQGKASRAWLLLAGSMHHMQINLVNGLVAVTYQDGSTDTLELQSPDNWWPIEQDYYNDGLAFKLSTPRPPRLLLKTGEWSLESGPVLAKNHTLKIDGGAATMLELPLNPDKELKSLQLRTLSNDLVIGLMAVTLQRE